MTFRGASWLVAGAVVCGATVASLHGQQRCARSTTRRCSNRPTASGSATGVTTPKRITVR